MQSLHKVTSHDKNVQYDVYANGREVIKENRAKKVHRITNELTSQGHILKAILEHTSNKMTSVWSEAQKLLPKNIFNFSVRYLNNSLPTKKNMKLWGRVENELCNFCQLPQSLLHVVSGCMSMLEGKRYTWRHNSVLLTIGNFLTGIRKVKIYADDIPGFRPSAVITGHDKRPDLLVINKDVLYVLELSVGFETNIAKNEVHKKRRYENLLKDLSASYLRVEYINLSMGAIGTIGINGHKALMNMLQDLSTSKQEQLYLVKKIITICIRCTYYIFCKRDSEWTSPELLTF